MAFARRVILPATSSGALIYAIWLVARAWSLDALAAHPLAGWIAGICALSPFTAGGLLLVGLPVAALLRRREVSYAWSVPLLAAAGLVGGALMAGLMLMLLVSAAEELRVVPPPLATVLIGAASGLATALVWAAFNRDLWSEADRARHPARR